MHSFETNKKLIKIISSSSKNREICCFKFIFRNLFDFTSSKAVKQITSFSALLVNRYTTALKTCRKFKSRYSTTSDVF